MRHEMKCKTRYTEDEIEHLRILFKQKKSDEEIASIMGRGVEGIRYKRRRLGLHRPDAVAISVKKGHKWTKDELQFIRNFWNKKTDRWMASKLGVSVRTYKHKRQRMVIVTIEGRKRLIKKWTQAKGRRLTWTYNQEEFLRENYPTHSAKELAEYLGRKENAVQYKAKRMGLKKAFSPGRKGYGPVEKYYNPQTFKPKQII